MNGIPHCRALTHFEGRRHMMVDSTNQEALVRCRQVQAAHTLDKEEQRVDDRICLMEMASVTYFYAYEGENNCIVHSHVVSE